jgi:hypothetical protein
MSLDSGDLFVCHDRSVASARGIVRELLPLTTKTTSRLSTLILAYFGLLFSHATYGAVKFISTILSGSLHITPTNRFQSGGHMAIWVAAAEAL